jgi:hypothetical protein
MIDVTRSKTAPSSLAAKKGPFQQDVREQLMKDFHQKCYLCETRIVTGLQVEHLEPVAVSPERKYDWTNLFPVDGCNQRKGHAWPEGGYLDPTEEYSINDRLHQCIETDYLGARRITFESIAEDDTPAENTARLLEKLHNEPGKDSAWHLRKAIEERYNLVHKMVTRYLLAEGPEARREARARLLAMLGRRADYSGLIRSTLAREGLLPKEIAAALK